MHITQVSELQSYFAKVIAYCQEEPPFQSPETLLNATRSPQTSLWFAPAYLEHPEGRHSANILLDGQ